MRGKMFYSELNKDDLIYLLAAEIFDKCIQAVEYGDVEDPATTGWLTSKLAWQRTMEQTINTLEQCGFDGRKQLSLCRKDLNNLRGKPPYPPKRGKSK